MFEWFVKKLCKDNRGFTLIELVVVIAILAILAFIAVPKLAGTTDKAAVSAHNANVRTLESAASMCIAEEGKPKTDITWGGTKTSGEAYKWEDYIQEWPTVPESLVGKTWLKSEDDTVGITINQNYKVIIYKNGTIEVQTGSTKTGKIINKTK
ncbi:type II secretion system protein [Anaerosalibacter sp. Marseille-P3206]|uniref:type II secretion system protein n=1 Tax=Anaerosalibacter sp. Marseille-P3206 TaxID=1871005 RepID=UPI0009850D8A|nr:type II secretion system protein [Anaerosalibacter sp. Marseille-P3206]